jgi:hypothetical protein
LGHEAHARLQAQAHKTIRPRDSNPSFNPSRAGTLRLRRPFAPNPSAHAARDRRERERQTMAAAQQKIRWGELEEDDGGDLDFLLPPRVVIGPDASGLKKVIEYRFDDEGNKVKVTTTTRVRKLAKTNLSKSAIERRSWPKFGDALKEDAGSRLTMVSTEEILLERPRAPGLRPRSLSLDPSCARIYRRN